ncbi:hypothetical protein FA15DRAFT_662871 [Coprinopsis marcescibilis]|uniref:DUF1212-domain-containing protein n=1 Tax=Coprinopsis marcescibilis TaxID=230819 RepID=A0A5C3LDU4_COPMA|nr:hypothetical protein FA15DRAFT_662871 [Coprinopsis marcescibilis]
MTFGAPSHRIESQVKAAAQIMELDADCMYLPNMAIISMRLGEKGVMRTFFIRARGRVALTSLQKVHQIYRNVLHDNLPAASGTHALKRLLLASPIYNLGTRCFLAFMSASIICGLSFGGSILDMWISGICACALQYLGLNAANKSAMYANVYEISVTIVVAFVARGLSSIPGDLFCYTAISSAGVVVILPGFTVLISALELMSRNIFCGSVRIVYAIIYTLFLGFGLTIGSDLYLLVDPKARKNYYHSTSDATNHAHSNLTYLHGTFMMLNGSSVLTPITGVLGIHEDGGKGSNIIVKGCVRDVNWEWWRQQLPWWTMFLLVPIYSTCSSLSNLQYWRSMKLLVMVFISCCSFAANRASGLMLPGRTDIVSAAGALVIGTLGNIYSRLGRGTAFTTMVTGVLFLVPSGIAQGGGVTQTFHTSEEQYSSGFSLALRMVTVAAGVTIGLFVSQCIVYLFGARKNAAHFAF